MTDNIAMHLPVPFIDIDGSVTHVRLVRYKTREWMSLRDDNNSVVIGDADHARAIARALLIAADLLDKGGLDE